MAVIRMPRIGQTTFSEFWLCVQEVLDAMNTAAEERRHGGVVAYLSEVVSSPELFDRCKALFDSKVEAGTFNSEAKVPSIAWFKYQFWPSNEHVRSALLHTGRFPLRLQLQVRNSRKEHGHAYYCAKQKSLAKEFAIKYRDHACAIQPDDKQNLNIGEPGTAAAVLAKQKPTMGPVTPATAVGHLSGQQNQEANSRAIDHDAGSVKMRIIPTVHLVQDIPTDRDESMCRGQVYITLKNSIFEPSEANKAMLEIEKSLKLNGGSLKSIVWEHADGGGEHHTGHPSVIVATINFWLRNNDKVDRIVKTRGAPYHSYLHEVEKVMSILNLGLYNVALERPRIDQSKFPGLEARFQSSKNMAELRAYGLRFPALANGLRDALKPVNELLYQRFERLQLKGVPFLRGETVTAGEADTFFDAIKPLLSAAAAEHQGSSVATSSARTWRAHESRSSSTRTPRWTHTKLRLTRSAGAKPCSLCARRMTASSPRTKWLSCLSHSSANLAALHQRCLSMSSST